MIIKLLSFGDLEAQEDYLARFTAIELSTYDLILFTGDIPNPAIFKLLSKQMVEKGLGDLKGKPNIAKETEPKEALKKVEKEFWMTLNYFKKLHETGKFYGVWGNADNMKMLNKVPIQNFINLAHNKIIKVARYSLIGYNGRPLYIFEKENKEQWAFEEEKAYKDLEMLFKKVNPSKTILLTHAPPYQILDQVDKNYRKYAIGTYGKKAIEGHIGSIAFRKIVEKYQPLIHIFGHIHESKGVKKLNNTTCINTGCLGEHKEYAVTTINEHVRVKFNKV